MVQAQSALLLSWAYRNLEAYHETLYLELSSAPEGDRRLGLAT